MDHLNQVVSFDFNSHQEVKDLFEHHSSKLGAEIEGYCKDQLGYLYHDRNLKGDFKSIYEGVINDFLLILERNDSDFTTALFKLLSGEQSNILMGLEHTCLSPLNDWTIC